MMAPVELSILIPVYNGEDFLLETIDSVISNSQDFSIECIVIDDGSTDKTSDIIKSYGRQIRTIYQANSGESSAVNTGLQAAAGQYIMVVSADDPVLTPRIFSGVQDFFKGNPEIVAWYPDWNIIDEKGRVLQSKRLPDYRFRDLFCKNRVLPGPGTWFRADTAKAIGGRNTRWKYVGDYDFWLRLSQRGNFAHRSGVFAQWRRHSRSTSISERGLGMAQERIEVIEEFVNDYGQSFALDEISLARAHAHYLAARLGFFSSEVSARRLIIKAVRTDPRVLLSVKPHELLFMLGFPMTRYALNAFVNLRKF